MRLQIALYTRFYLHRRVGCLPRHAPFSTNKDTLIAILYPYTLDPFSSGSFNNIDHVISS